jgi:hypothetical protein
LSQAWQAAAIVLQIFQLAILLFHDWIPLGSLTDVEAVRRANTGTHMLVGTAINSVPAGLVAWRSVVNFGPPYSHGLKTAMWLIYGILFAGELYSWWVPYLFGASPAKVERFQKMFGRTHAFLPVRHGIVPNTLHVILHLATLGTLLVLTQL